MMFVGDFAWFMFSADRMIHLNEFPLVGITTSQTWLHQGPLWTYMIAPILLISTNPLGVGYFSVLIGVITILVIYKVAEEMFSKSIGLIASFIFATSPLIVIFSRMPYHTSPIPLVMLLLIWLCFRWVKYGWKYFPFVIATVALLYNFELATVVVVPVIFIIGYFITKKHGIQSLFHVGTIFLTLFLSILIMFPVILYDINNGFLQTLKFAHWSIYLRVIKPFFESGTANLNINSSTHFFFENFHRTIFLENSIVAFGILILFIVFLAYRFFMRSRFLIGEKVVWLFFLITFSLLFVNQTQSDAYIPILFVPLILLMSVAFFLIFQSKKIVLTIVVLILGSFNVISLLKNDYLMQVPNGYGLKYEERIKAVEKILSTAKKGEINLIPSDNNLSNIILPYEYLLRRKGVIYNPNASEEFEIYELLDRVDVQYVGK